MRTGFLEQVSFLHHKAKLSETLTTFSQGFQMTWQVYSFVALDVYIGYFRKADTVTQGSGPAHLGTLSATW